jgi:hypothetical protein
MGYYTNYTLKVTGFENAEAAEIFEFSLQKKTEYSGWDFDIVHTKNGYEVEATLNEAKWYDWQSDLEILSRKFPAVVITVGGVGEEPGDIWRARVQNGETKQAKATISFPGLD